MVVALPLLLLLAAQPAAPGTRPCDRRPLVDLQLVEAATVAFAGRLVRSERAAPRATYRVTTPIKGRIRAGQRVTVTHCGDLPGGTDHVVFTDARRHVLAGASGVEPTRPERVSALSTYARATDDRRRADLLVGRYRDHQDRRALTALIDAPALLAQLDDPARDALIALVGRTPWTRVEVAALARLRRPTASGLLSLALVRCDTADFDTPCDRAIPHALELSRRRAAAPDPEGLAACLRSCPDPLDRHLALDRCEELRGEPFDAGFAHPSFHARFGAAADDAQRFPPDGDATWHRAASWCEAPTPPPRRQPTRPPKPTPKRTR